MKPEGSGRKKKCRSCGRCMTHSSTYQVQYRNGKAVKVEKTELPADVEMTTETFGQAATGQLTMGDIVYRAGTKVNGNLTILAQVFLRKL